MGTEAENMDLIRRMYQGFSDIDPEWMTSCFTDDGVIHIVCLEPWQGRDAIYAMFERWRNDYGGIHSELKNVASGPDLVMTEWVDHYDWNGVHYDIPLMGTFTFAGDKITAWRMYVDRILADMVGGQYPEVSAGAKS
jgi:limonene-1,2-epoxide hydrolase